MGKGGGTVQDNRRLFPAQAVKIDKAGKSGTATDYLASLFRLSLFSLFIGHRAVGA